MLHCKRTTGAWVSAALLAFGLSACSSPPEEADLELKTLAQQVPAQQHAPTITGCDFTTGIEGPSVGKDGTLYVPNLGTKGSLGALDTKDANDSFSVVKPTIGVTPNGSRAVRDRLYVVDKGQTVDGVHSDMGLKIQDLNDLSAAPLVLDFLTGAGLNGFSVADRTWEINDLDIANNGDIYISAPCWGGCPNDDQGRIYRLNIDDIDANASGVGATVQTVLTGVIMPNGIAVGPKGRNLFVATGGGADWSNGWPAPVQPLRILRFAINNDGSLGPEEEVIHLRADEFVYLWAQDLDGLRADSKGNLYVANFGGSKLAPWDPPVPGEVHYIDADAGTVLSTITVDTPNVTNIAFGGPGRKTLYITGHDGTCGSVAAIDVPHPGRNYQKIN